MKKTKKKVYGMAKDFITTKHHPGYDYKKGVKWNVKKAINYAKEKGLSLLQAGRQLQMLANMNKKHPKVHKVYKKSAEEVFKEYEGEQKQGK